MGPKKCLWSLTQVGQSRVRRLVTQCTLPHEKRRLDYTLYFGFLASGVSSERSRQLGTAPDHPTPCGRRALSATRPPDKFIAQRAGLP